MQAMYRLFGALERQFAHLQGKGMGAHSMQAEIKAVKKLQPQLGLVIDIGGNVGNYSHTVLSYFPKANIHLFEPAGANITKLQQRFAGQSQITINQKAVGETAGLMTLYADQPGSGLASLSKRDLSHHNIRFEYEEQVEVVRFDQYYHTHFAGQTIDLVKIDVEGHEMAVLAGFGEVLNKVRVFQFEFGGCNVDTRTYFRDFWDFFTKRGFFIYRITPLGLQQINKYKEADEVFTTTNFLAYQPNH